VSTAEILEELRRLTPEERREIRTRLAELDDAWDDGSELSEEQKQLIESRIAEHERHPELAVPWNEFERRLNERLGE
jgi:putative addiction module component (TIGR02574 family)